MKVIISNHYTEYSIAIPTAAQPVEQTAAEELKQYLYKASGAALSVVTEKDVRGNAFYIGHTDYAKSLGLFGKTKENWLITEKDGNVVLTGGVEANDRGIIYAVYHFLEDIVGVRWWSCWEEYVPELSELSLADDFYKEGTPAFPYRKILSCIDGMSDFFYEARNRGNVVGEEGIAGGVYHPSIKKLGGAMPMGRPQHCHTLSHFFPAEEYFEAHPEWFAWSEALGERLSGSSDHYCLTNEEFADAILNKVLSYIEEDRFLAEKEGVELPCFYSVSFPDSVGKFCECEACKKVLEESGESGYALRFVNKIARGVAEKYPDVKIETLIYHMYLNPPKDDTLPEKNIILRLAQVYVDIIHDIHAKGNRWYLQLLKQWSDICKKVGCELYIWEYMYNLFLDFPMPAAYRLSDTFRTFHQYGVSGVFVENECTTMDMWELVQFMLVHLAEDPYADEEELINDFMDKFYGKAGVYVKEYLNELKRAATENDFSCFCIIESAHFNYLDAQAVHRGMELLRKAREAVAGDSVHELRIIYMQALLGASLLIKFYDLKRMAKRQGIPFEYEAESVRNNVISWLEASKKLPRISWKDNDVNWNKNRINHLIEYLNQLTFNEEDTPALPSELSDVKEDDVYQFLFKNLSRHIDNGPERFGFSIVEDAESSTGRVARMCITEGTQKDKVRFLYMTSQEAEHKKPVSIYIEQDAKPVSGIDLYREHVVPNQYNLYLVGSVSGIPESGDTRVDIFGDNYDWLSLTGISVVFPMEACDVYLSMKFTGEMYGGSPDDVDAIFVDRAIVVRR